MNEKKKTQMFLGCHQSLPSSEKFTVKLCFLLSTTKPTFMYFAILVHYFCCNLLQNVENLKLYTHMFIAPQSDLPNKRICPGFSECFSCLHIGEIFPLTNNSHIKKNKNKQPCTSGLTYACAASYLIIYSCAKNKQVSIFHTAV